MARTASDHGPPPPRRARSGGNCPTYPAFNPDGGTRLTDFPAETRGCGMSDPLLLETVATGVVVQGPDAFVEAFEEAWQLRGPVELDAFLPAADHPLYLLVLGELIRVALE